MRDTLLVGACSWLLPVPPATLAAALELTIERVRLILDDLEGRLTFLFRDPRGDITWAYPLTAEPMPHRLAFDSGERLYAA
jgi:hypothetical protein